MIIAVVVRQVRIFSEILFLKQISTWRNKWRKKYFTKSFSLLYFESLGPILAFSAVVFARYPVFEPWCAPQNDPFLTKKGEKVFFGPQGALLCRKNGMVGVVFSAQYVR